MANGLLRIPVGWASDAEGSIKPLFNRMWERASHHKLSSWGRRGLLQAGQSPGRRGWQRKKQWQPPLWQPLTFLSATWEGGEGTVDDPPQPRVVRCNVVRRKQLARVGSLVAVCVPGFPPEARLSSTLAVNLYRCHCASSLPLLWSQAPAALHSFLVPVGFSLLGWTEVGEARSLRNW